MIKRTIMILLVLILGVSFTGCGSQKKDEVTSKIKVKNTDEYKEEEREPLILKEDVNYVIVALKNKYVVINSEEDFVNLSVAYIGETDGELYANYYDFKNSGMFNAVNDLHSGITGKNFDVGLIDEEKLSTYDDWEIVWEMKR